MDVKENDVKKRVEKDFPSEEFYLLPDGSGSYFTNEDNQLKFYDAQDVVVWVKQVFGRTPGLLGLSDEYVAVAWEVPPSPNSWKNDLVEVYILKTGVRVLSLECRWAMKNFAYVQFSSSRFAYSAPWCINRPEFKIFVIFVYDLKTGKQILTYRDLRVFRFNNATNFVLEKDQIIFEHDEKLHSAKFWI